MSTNSAAKPSPWSLPVESVIRELSSDREQGLSDAAVQAALEKYGPNQLREKQGRPAWLRFLDQFMDFMIGLLALAAIVSAAVGEWQDGILIGLIVLANGIIGFMQEQRAEAAMAALKRLSQPRAKAWRNGELKDLPVAELVPGDIVEIGTGDHVPADSRLLHGVDLQTDEAPLTGESLPIEKSPAPLPAETPLAERANMLFMGTAVTRGRGQGIVTSTGMDTELGKIAELLESTEDGSTPLEDRLDKLSKQLAVIVIGVCIVMFVTAWVRLEETTWENLSELFLTAVSLAVAAVPEGLPAVITVALAMGSQRMAARKAIIRQLAAVETLGSVDVICSDKTGTLTQGKMILGESVLAAQVLDRLSETETDQEPLFRAAVLCNDAQWSDEGKAIGSPTETALLVAARDKGYDPRKLRKEWPRLTEFPFGSERKRMSAVHEPPAGSRTSQQGPILYAKGATEQILARSTQVWRNGSAQPLSDQDRAALQESSEKLAERGRRVLGVAYRPVVKENPPQNAEEAESGLVFLGYVGIVDPVRPEVKVAIELCRNAGVRPVMITGDHPGTARAIAEELGLMKPGDELFTGPELDTVSDEELLDHVGKTAVYARVTPTHKLRIVKAHQARGSVSAMTGDGVNDAPALKQADIGVAMGIQGTDVSKEAAKMVLADDNFATIVAAVEEGRVVYDNIRKFVRYLLSSNTGEIFVLFVAVLLGWPMPLLPVHLLWVNLVTDGLPALALGFEPAERGIMKRPPRKRQESLFAGGMVRDILMMGAFMAINCLILFWWSMTQHNAWDLPRSSTEYKDALAYAQTMAFLALSMFQLFYVLSLRSSVDSFLSDPLGNMTLIYAVLLGTFLQIGVIYLPLVWPGASEFFNTVPLGWFDLVITLGISMLAFVVAEVHKLVGRRREATA